jgi:hypothetical protein
MVDTVTRRYERAMKSSFGAEYFTPTLIPTPGADIARNPARHQHLALLQRPRHVQEDAGLRQGRARLRIYAPLRNKGEP